MSDAAVDTLIATLGDASARIDTARAIATAAGADQLFAFVPHAGKLLPAAGFQQSLPSSRGWRELLARCDRSGVHAGEVAYPKAEATRPAVALAYDGMCLVFVGTTRIPDELAAAIGRLAPLLGALLNAETTLHAAQGQLAVERQAAERSAALARALDLARAEAERATRVKDEFLAMLGHELRNPLAPIVTALQLLRMDGVHTRAQDILERQVSHLLRLVDDLLDVSRITSGKIELRKEPLEIVNVVQRAVEMARPILEQRQNELTIDVPERGLYVEGDPARLAQVVTNLVTNAAKYSNARTPIRIVAEREHQVVRIAVEDRGTGIAPEYLDRIFDRFVQVPQGIDRSDGGLGLGLAIVKSLVEMHGGQVRAFSDGLGRGSRFVVELPASPEPPKSQVAAERRSEPNTAASNVLVVDDNIDAAELLGEILTAYGHRVHVATSGPDALAALARFTPDAALLDIGLPAMDGYELARRMRQQLPHVRLVALTGYGRSDDRARTAEAGFDAHLVKPVSIARVTETLAKLLR